MEASLSKKGLPMDEITQVVKDYEAKQQALMNARWAVGFHDRGMGHGDFGVIAEGGGFKVVWECPCCGTKFQDSGMEDELPCPNCGDDLVDVEDLKSDIIENPGGELIVKCPSREIADHIVELHNQGLRK